MKRLALCLALIAPLAIMAKAATAAEAPVSSYQQLANLFADWRTFNHPAIVHGRPDYSAAAYPTFEHFLDHLTQILAAEAKALANVGVDVIQLDDPALTYFCDRRLTSVGKIIRSCWPPPERPIPPDVIENARDRGEQVDRLFAAYVLGKLNTIPAGTRCSSRNLLPSLCAQFLCPSGSALLPT